MGIFTFTFERIVRALHRMNKGNPASGEGEPLHSVFSFLEVHTMKRLTVLLALLLAIGIFASSALAQSEAAVLFLLISPGARAAGMGESFVAIADDATAVYWNPAGLAFQRGHEISLMHANWLPQFQFNDMYFDFAAYRQYVEGLGTIGGNVTFLNLGEQQVTLEGGPEVVDTFNSFEFAVTLSYGTKLTENLGIGVNLRYIRSNLSSVGAGSEKGNGKANGYAVDLGVLYHPAWFSRLSLGANLSNLGPKIAYIDADQADPLPTNLRMGFALKIIDQKYNRLTLAADVNKLLVRRYKDGTSDPFYKAVFTSWTDESFDRELEMMIRNVGVEYVYSDLIFLRGGYVYDKKGKVNYATFGAGLQYSLYRFDFGYVAGGEDLPLSDTMRFSLTIGF